MAQQKLTDRTFGLAFAAIFSIFATVGWLAFGVIVGWLLIGSGLFLAIALIAPGALLPFNRLWSILAGRIHRVVNFTLLASFFYLLILPFGLIMRLFGRDPLKRTPVPKTATYWHPVTRHTDETTLPDMF
ncbi:MAG: hypothetical protein HQ494_06860 [Rhodospirillales bacterium]|nr:hypothetical protein [Rhodospirillales bacterium]